MSPFIYLLAVTGATADVPSPRSMPSKSTESIVYTVPLPNSSFGKNRAARPINSPGRWVTPDDYPDQSIRARESGTTGFRLDVDADGKVSSCTVTSSSGSATLDDITCQKVSQRAYFQPAQDKKGKKTAGTYSNSVRWVLPRPDPIPEAGVTVGSYTVDRRGHVTSCHYKPGSEGARWRSCEDFPETFEPYLNADGKPVAVKVTISTAVRVTEIKAEGDADESKDSE